MKYDKKDFVEVRFCDLWSSMVDIGSLIIASPVLRSQFRQIKIRVHAEGVDLMRISPVPPEGEVIKRAGSAGPAPEVAS